MRTITIIMVPIRRNGNNADTNNTGSQNQNTAKTGTGIIAELAGLMMTIDVAIAKIVRKHD